MGCFRNESTFYPWSEVFGLHFTLSLHLTPGLLFYWHRPLFECRYIFGAWSAWSRNGCVPCLTRFSRTVIQPVQTQVWARLKHSFRFYGIKTKQNAFIAARNKRKNLRSLCGEIFCKCGRVTDVYQMQTLNTIDNLRNGVLPRSLIK